MLQFVDLKQETPEKRDTSERKEDFQEIYDEFITDKAKEQSSRCSQCGVPFCQIHCPLSNNFLKAQTICRKYVEEFVPRIDSAKAIV